MVGIVNDELTYTPFQHATKKNASISKDMLENDPGAIGIAAVCEDAAAVLRSEAFGSFAGDMVECFFFRNREVDMSER